MKKTILILTIVMAAVVATKTIHRTEAQQVVAIAPEPITDILTEQQRVWINALRWCESRGIDSSINPKDRDNTPSWGRYQFKPDTFKNYQALYGLKTSTLMDGEAQERIVEQMIIRGGIKWSNEFPECTRKLGTPPKSKLSTPKELTTANKGVK